MKMEAIGCPSETGNHARDPEDLDLDIVACYQE